MDRKLTERRFPSKEVITTFNTIVHTEDSFMKSMKDPDKAMAASASVVALHQGGLVHATAEQLELVDGEIGYKIEGGELPPHLTSADVNKLVDVTDRYSYQLNEDDGSFVLKESK